MSQPNFKPGKNPADILNGTRKRKASERSRLANDLTLTEPKKAKTTRTTGQKKPVAKKAASVGMTMKPTASLNEALTRPMKNMFCKFLFMRIKKFLTYLLSQVTPQPTDAQGSESGSVVAKSGRSSTTSSLRHSVGIEEVVDEDYPGHSRNVSPSSASQLIESADGSDDDEVELVGQKRARTLPVINDDVEDVPAAEEAEEVQRGMIC
jgi:hypothetical protein